MARDRSRSELPEDTRVTRAAPTSDQTVSPAVPAQGCRAVQLAVPRTALGARFSPGWSAEPRLGAPAFSRPSRRSGAFVRVAGGPSDSADCRPPASDAGRSEE